MWLTFCLLKNTSQITNNWLIFEKKSFSATYILEMFQCICKQVLPREHMYSIGETLSWSEAPVLLFSQIFKLTSSLCNE